MAIQALVVPALDNYPDRNFVDRRQLVVVTNPVVDFAASNFDCGVVDIFFNFGAPNAARGGKIILSGV